MKKSTKTVAGLLASLLLSAGLASPAFAQPDAGGQETESTDTSRLRQNVNQEEEEKPAARSQQLDTAIAIRLQKIYELMAAEQLRPALAEIDKLIAEKGGTMKPFDKATTYEMRGSIKAQLEDYRGALKDFEVALGANALPAARNNQLRYFIAQLYFQLEDYQSAIRGLNEWIRSATAAGQKVDCNAYYLLSAAYVQLTPPNHRQALGPGEQALACLTEPKKGYYDLLNLIYSELNENKKRADLLEKMINIWPGERSYWTQLSGLYSTTGRDAEAFSVLEVAYRAGLLKNENEILTLVQYYSFYDNPYRGAKLLEREMATGAVKENVKNLTLLSQLWSQAREHKRAIPVLEKSSKLSSDGELSYRLGQVLVADEQYAKAEVALRTALNKGGMNATQTGDCNLLLGTAIFAQAGPGDRDIRKRAREAFSRATNYPNVAAQARQWVAYIDAIDKTECDQDKLECQQRNEQRLAEVDRKKQQAQVCRLQNGGARCDAILAEAKELEAQSVNCEDVCKKPASAPELTPAPAGSPLNQPDAPVVTPEAATAPRLEAEKPTAPPPAAEKPKQ
jgi:tetratricopeptide (TPR) repeat protein